MRTLDFTPALLDQTLTQLKDFRLFAGVPDDERRLIVSSCSLHDAGVGERVLEQGAPSDATWLLLSGEAALQYSYASDEPPADLGVLQPGATLGELGALLDEPREVSVIATRPCRMLRMSSAQMTELFRISPAFATATLRALARNVKSSLIARNQSEIDEMPSAVRLERPDVSEQRSYLTEYYGTVLRSIAGRHRLLVDRRYPTYEAPFRMTEEERQRWWSLFGTEPTWGPTVPFLYCSTSGTLLLMKVVSAVGVNLRHLLHLNGEMYFDPENPLVPDETYRMSLRLEDIAPMGADRIALVVNYRVQDEQGRLRYSTREFFIIKHLSPEYIKMLNEASRYGRTDTSHLRGLSKRATSLTADHTIRTLQIPENMATEYGRISGDPSIWHTTPLTARLFGFKKPFIQGLCTTNTVLNALTGAGLGPVSALNVSYTRHVYVGQTVELRGRDHHFELVDEAEHLLAFGTWERGRGGRRSEPQP